MKASPLWGVSLPSFRHDGGGVAVASRDFAESLILDDLLYFCINGVTVSMIYIEALET
jgi:hypothetical protein